MGTVVSMKVRNALKAAAVCRGAKLDQPTLTLYSNRLTREAEEDVLLALEKLAEMPRHEHESALPDLGSLVALVETCRIARQNRAVIEQNRKPFYLICDYCGSSELGFYAPASRLLSEKMFCKSMYGPIGSNETLPRGTICGHTLRVERFESYEEAQQKEAVHAQNVG